MCGEQSTKVGLERHAAGSPPRVRGTAWLTMLFSCYPGITPACAGNSGWHTKVSPIPRDHPRVCGEQYASIEVTFGKTGSPPRVRGTASFTLLFDT